MELLHLHHLQLYGYGGFLPRTLSLPCSPSCIAPTPSRRRPTTLLITARARSRRPRSPDPPAAPDLDDDDNTIVLESREETRRRHWIERHWAPWEEKLSPEMQFAVDSLREGVDEPVVSKEMFERMYIDEPLFPDHLFNGEDKEDPEEVEAREHGAIPGTDWRKTEVFALIPPRDWPPSGWKVDRDELAFIRSAHSLKNKRITTEDLKNAKSSSEEANFDRWNMFMKQYQEWVAANKDRLEQEEEELDDEYYPGRRRIGSDYTEGMYELPFIYPGQHYVGEVTCVHLYEGAFVDFGAVHDGWVPIKRNDWYYIREHIKVGKLVQVEVIAKRDPYRFRFPIEMHFVHPNIDHLIFKRFNHPPIIWRDEDHLNPDEITREAGRPYWPKRRPDPADEKEELMLRHPYVFKVWQMHMAEQMVLDDEEKRAVESGPVTPVVIDEDESKRHYIDEDSYWTQEKMQGVTLPSLYLTQHEWELDIDGAREERKAIDKARDEAQARGEKFKVPKLKREIYMEELDASHYQRYIDENEALERDKICRLECGLSLEEPGRYADDSFFGENKYNPREKRWRHDYVGDLTKSKDDGKKEREPRPRTAEIVPEEDIVPTSWGSSYTKQEEISVLRSDENEESSVANPTGSGKSSSSTGAKVVNGTESSRVIDIKNMFKIRLQEEQTDADGTDASDNPES